jgi:hypothetical protein
MKKIIACFFAFLLSLSSVPETGNGYIKIDAIATAPDVFTLPDGSTIKIYSDVLQLNESYILLIDTLNDNEVLNYWDFETYELNNYNY